MEILPTVRLISKPFNMSSHLLINIIRQMIRIRFDRFFKLIFDSWRFVCGAEEQNIEATLTYNAKIQTHFQKVGTLSSNAVKTEISNLVIHQIYSGKRIAEKIFSVFTDNSIWEI